MVNENLLFTMHPQSSPWQVVYQWSCMKRDNSLHCWVQGIEADTDLIKTEFADMITWLCCTIYCYRYPWLPLSVVETVSLLQCRSIVKCFGSHWVSPPPSSIEWKTRVSVLYTCTIKVDKQSHLTKQSLDDLLYSWTGDKIPLTSFNPDPIKCQSLAVSQS